MNSFIQKKWLLCAIACVVLFCLLCWWGGFIVGRSRYRSVTNFGEAFSEFRSKQGTERVAEYMRIEPVIIALTAKYRVQNGHQDKDFIISLLGKPDTSTLDQEEVQLNRKQSLQVVPTIHAIPADGSVSNNAYRINHMTYRLGTSDETLKLLELIFHNGTLVQYLCLLKD